VHQPRVLLVRRARPTARQQGCERGKELRLHEQLREGGVRRMVGCRREHDFGEAGELEPDAARRAILEREPAHFEPGRGGDRDVEPGGDAIVLAFDTETAGHPARLVVFRLMLNRVMSHGPKGATCEIAHVD
jgi:hypothetical protein